jgi:hypothetical protein
MSYRLRLTTLNDRGVEYIVLVNTEKNRVQFEEYGVTKDFGNISDVFEYLARFCFSGEI